MKQLTAPDTELPGLNQTADAMGGDFHAGTQAARLVVLPGEIGHTNSAMDMEEENCVTPKAATPLPEKGAHASSTEEARDARCQRVMT